MRSPFPRSFSPCERGFLLFYFTSKTLLTEKLSLGGTDLFFRKVESLFLPSPGFLREDGGDGHDFSVNWKPTCFARGQSMKGLPGYSSGCILLLVVPAIKRKENIHEPIQEVITCVVALPVSFGMGTEVSVPDSARRGWS